jgi:hypothetical protein
MDERPQKKIDLGPRGGVLVPASPRANQSLAEAFPQPSDESILAWRYIDLPKLVDLLAHRRLCLARLDQFPDKLEGSVPRGHYDELHPDTWVVTYYPATSIRGSDREGLADHQRMRLYGTYASCWRLDTSESELAWRGCNGGKNALAIALPYSRLAQSVNWHNTFIGCVRYIDYKTERFPDFNWHSHTYMHKSLEFRSEQEARIIYHPDGWAGRDGRRKVGPEDTDRVIFAPWDAEQLIERIVVSPAESSLFASAVKDVIAAFSPNLLSRLRSSALLREPAY